jgi:hypothetical protein
MNGSMVYLYDNDQTDYMVIFGEKVLISYRYYEVTHDWIDMAFLKEFYQSID